MQVVMEGNPGFFKLAKGVDSVGFKMCIVNEIQSGPNNTYKPRFHLASKHTQKNLFHILILGPSPLGNHGDPLLKMSEIGTSRHGPEAAVDLCFPTHNTLGCPANDVILEDSFVELVQQVRRKAGGYVAVGKISPEWVIGSKS